MISIKKKRKGRGWTVWLAAGAVPELLKLPARLREVLKKPDFADTVVARLFPPAYGKDPQAEAEYQHLLREDLLQRKLKGVESFERTLERRQEVKLLLGPPLVQVDLAEEDLSLWLGFFHDMRLLIGTRLDITDESWERRIDPRDPDAEELILLHGLAYLEEAIVEALRGSEKLGP